jgi:hypothetical protein
MTAEVLTTVKILVSFLRVVAPCGLVEITNVPEEHTAAVLSPEDGGSKHLRNVGT